MQPMALTKLRFPMRVRLTLVGLILPLLVFCLKANAGQGCPALNTCSTPIIQNDSATFSLDDTATLPENTVFLGGSLTDKANRRMPVLLLSLNGGHTWQQITFGFEGSGIVTIQTYGVANVWALITFQQEGAHNPEYLLRSVDAGKTWCIVSLDFIDIKDPFVWLKDLRFFDGQNGTMFLSGSNGGSGAYYTHDGGIRWNRLWETQKNTPADVDGEYRYPDLSPPPAHAPLWTKQDDFYKITGLVRFRKGEGDYIVENYDYGTGEGWKVVSRLSKAQKADGTTFKRRTEMCLDKTTLRR
jgi:hypothetical protein